MSRGRLDVLIVGAGPTGLTLAIECQRHGLTYRIVEQATERTGLSKALGIWHGTMEALAAMGVVEEFQAAAAPLERVRFADRGRTIATVRHDQNVDTLYPQPLLLPQCDTERLLEAHLERLGGSVERGVRLTGLEPHSDYVALELRHSYGRTEKVEAAWVAGCDGAHSAVRHAVEIPFDGFTEAEMFLLCDARAEGPVATNEILISWSSTGHIAIFPVREGVWRVVANRGNVADRSPPDLAEIQHHVDTHGPQGIRLHDPTWLTSFRVSERLATRFRQGRCFLLGDAAHIHSPAGGQGMNTGIQDACNLGWKLALMCRGHGDIEALAESYHAERRPVAERVIREAAKKMRFALTSGPVMRVLKDAVLACASRSAKFHRNFTRELSELAIRYKEGPLLAHCGEWPKRAERHGFLPGTRARDCMVLDAAECVPLSLWRKYLDCRHTLVLFSGPMVDRESQQRLDAARAIAVQYPKWVHIVGVWHGMMPPSDMPGVDWLLDPQGEAHRKHGVATTSWYLIRPDQYVAMRCQPAQAEPLADYLKRLTGIRASQASVETIGVR